MKIAVYHNLPSGGAKRSLYELIDRTSDHHEYSLYRPDIPENQTYMDLRPAVKSVHSSGYSGLTADMLTGKNILQRRKSMKRFYRLESDMADAINKSDADAVFVMSCMFTHSPGILSLLQKPSLYFLQEPRRQSFEFNLSPMMQRLSASESLTDKANWLARQSFELDAVSRDMRAVRAASVVLCNSYFSHESIVKSYGVDARVCYLGVDTIFGSKSTTKREKKVLCVGALHPNKNQLLLMEAIGNLPKQDRPDVECVYDRAEESYRAQLIERAKDLGVKLVLSHQISDEELAHKYLAARAVVCLAELEPFGFTPLEANAAGTPVIALQEGGYRETVLHGETGLFVKRDAATVAEALKLVSKKRWSSDRLQAHAKQWSWERTVKQYTDSLEELVNA